MTGDEELREAEHFDLIAHHGNPQAMATIPRAELDELRWELERLREENRFWHRQDASGPIHDARDTEIGSLRAELERLHTWAGLMSLLDEHYPADVMTGESGDPGPRIVALVRELEFALKDNERMLAQHTADVAELERLRDAARSVVEAPDLATGDDVVGNLRTALGQDR